MSRLPLITLLISILIILHSMAYPPEIVTLRIIEILIGAVIFIYSIIKINEEIKRSR